MMKIIEFERIQNPNTTNGRHIDPLRQNRGWEGEERALGPCFGGTDSPKAALERLPDFIGFIISYFFRNAAVTDSF